MMWTGIWRELRYLLREKWDLCLVTLAPALVIILFSSMFAQGKPDLVVTEENVQRVYGVRSRIHTELDEDGTPVRSITLLGTVLSS